MSGIEETGKQVGKEVNSFLAGKPVWWWWIGYTALIGVLFGLFYFIIYILTVKWWITLIVIIATGMIWGTIAFYRNKSKMTGSAGSAG